MSKTSKENKKKHRESGGKNTNFADTDNQNHNIKKESLGPNTKR